MKKGKFSFLSVIIRTQGKREQGLREALLCLQAQECQDFEILLIAHKADEEHGKLIEEILEDQEEEFRKKIRFFRLNEGTRTTPLNYGFSHAWGKYAAVFDDDDILSQTGQREFKVCRRKRGPYSSFFCICTGLGKSGKLGYCAVAAPSANYCVPLI